MEAKAANMKRTLVFLLIFISNVTFAMSPESANASFSSWLFFSQGNGEKQLLWLSEENGSMLDGPFQGPMAFITDKKSNLWVGDSLNARVIVLDSSGRQKKEYDLIKAAKAARLASDPLLLDLIPSIDGRLLIADAANNAILEIDARNGKARAFTSPAGDSKFRWSQINRIHSDGEGCIYIEDVALRQTIILDKDGRPQQTLAGQIGVAVANSARMALIVANDSDPVEWQVLTCEKPGTKLTQLAKLNAENPIIWCSLIGYDSLDQLHAVYDTPLARHYVVFDGEGRMLKKHTTALHDPGYDVNRPDWIDKSGTIYTLQVKQPHLTILKLE